ncbi:MAG TPA: response regulator [Polyangiaceae bacterium]|jgi:PAS domain S-box-containing protein|nr:response regulator [Polyangiaceae bacterium]
MAATQSERARVWVVEDERIIARDLARTLTELGYQVAGISGSGEDAIRQVRADPPELVLMDVRLAGELDGIETAKAIKREHDVPIIFLTAHSDDETLSRASAAAPLAYLVKPFNGVDLKCSIELALRRHEIDARLRERERWLSTTLRSIGEGVVATDKEQRVVFLNPVAEALTGLSSEQAIGRALGQILKGVEGPESASNDEPPESTGESRVRKARNQRVQDRSTPMFDERGAVVGEVMVLRPVEEPQGDDAVTDERLERITSELGARLAVRTLELEVARREIDTFCSTVAHDLRAPLRGIDGFSRAIVEDHLASLGPEVLAHLNRIRRGATRMGELLDGLSRLAQLSRSDIASRSVDLSGAAEGIVEELRMANPSRRVAVEIASGMVVQGDPALWRIAVENLLRNAWKFSSKRAQAHIVFASFRREATAPAGSAADGEKATGRGETVYFVRDDGAGFDMRYAPRLFGMFQRLHRESDFEGTGIGLALVRRVIARHGGRTWAEGVPDVGATFYFALPDADGA